MYYTTEQKFIQYFDETLLDDEIRLDDETRLEERVSLFQFLFLTKMADPTRLELATSAVTGQRSNQLSYESTCWILYRI